MVDLQVVFTPAIELLKKFLELEFQFYGVTLQVQDVFIFTLIFIGVLSVFAIFKHE